MKRIFSNKILPISISILISFFTICLIYYASDVTQTLLLGLSMTFLTLYIIIRRVLNYGLSDPIFIFLSFFMFYNWLTLINLASSVKSGFLSIDLYPTFFSVAVVKYAGLLGMIALFGIIVGAAIYKMLFRYKRDVKFTLQNFDFRFLILIGFIFYLLGLVMFFISYQQIGGFFTSLSVNRLERFQILASAHTLPYPGFIFLGIALIFFAVFFYRSKKIFILAFFMLVIWAILLLLQGDRRLLIYSLLIVFVEWALFFGDDFIKRFGLKKIIFGLIIAFCSYLIFSFFSQVRFLIQILITKKWTIHESLVWISEHISLDWFMPGKTEFGGSYLTLLYSIKNKSDLLFGSSYFFSIPNILPRSLYPGIKPLTIADSFALKIYNEFYYFKDLMKGWGYNPVAEAFNNFGPFGVFVVFSFFGFIFEAIGRLRYKGFWSSLMYFMLVPELINFNRTSFASVLQEVVYFVVPVFALYVLYILFHEINGNS